MRQRAARSSRTKPDDKQTRLSSSYPRTRRSAREWCCKDRAWAGEGRGRGHDIKGDDEKEFCPLPDGKRIVEMTTRVYALARR